IVNTENVGDANANADYVTFRNGAFSTSFHVVEGGTASADLMAILTPTLQLQPSSSDLAFDENPNGVPDSTNWQFSLQLVGFENPSTGGFVTSVPEPICVALLTQVIVVVTGRRCHRRPLFARCFG